MRKNRFCIKATASFLLEMAYFPIMIMKIIAHFISITGMFIYFLLLKEFDQ